MCPHYRGSTVCALAFNAELSSLQADELHVGKQKNNMQCSIQTKFIIASELVTTRAKHVLTSSMSSQCRHPQAIYM